MKIILSRKGFDSASGGIASPILPDGRVVSLPIPDPAGSFKYSDLKLDKGKSYQHLLDELKPNHKINNNCHMDPDIYKEIVARKKSWKPIFGQSGSALGHLRKQGVEVGDLFLFFGWFRKTVEVDGKIVFDKSDREGRHIIFGYMQIGEMVTLDGSEKLPEWSKYHPHVYNRKPDKNNYIYIAADKLSWDKKKTGVGIFDYDDKLVLTKKGESRSKWNLPKVFKGLDISYHMENSWKNGYFQSARRGQEFVVDESEKVETWVKNLLK